MRHRIAFLIPIFLFLFRMTAGQVPSLGPDATVSLLTCGPGSEMYSYFGHSALRVKDPSIKLDRVYNYGTFDFNVPNFYTQFINGKLWYMLSVVRFQGFLPEYVSENRFIKERPIDLTPTERQKLFELLEINAQPENKHYWYDFFRDNCSTRIRDIVVQATDHRFNWPPEPAKTMTYRQLIRPYLAPNPWSRAGIMLMLASGADQQSTQTGYMFLPDYLDDLFGRAVTPDGQPMCLPERNLFMPQVSKSTGFNLFHPYVVFGLIMLISWILAAYRKIPRPVARTWFSILFFLTGAIGFLFTYMWLFSDHLVCHGNLNLLWAIPVNLFLSGTVWISGAGRFNRWYARIALITGMIFLITFPFWKQKVPPEAILTALSLIPGWILFSGLEVFGKSESHDQTNQQGLHTRHTD